MAATLITGSNRGIGLELARQLVDRGDKVVAVCRKSSAALEKLPLRIESGIDLTNPGNLADLKQRLSGVKLGVLVNNAGVLSRQNLGEIDDSALEAMRLQYMTNSLAPLLVTQALLDNLDYGSKVAIVTSRMGSLADNTSGGSYGYRMSKAAVNMVGVTLAQDLKERGIAVVLLHPGWVRTEMTGGTGMVDANEAARSLIERIDALTLENTGAFWHANGEALPW